MLCKRRLAGQPLQCAGSDGRGSERVGVMQDLRGLSWEAGPPGAPWPLPGRASSPVKLAKAAALEAPPAPAHRPPRCLCPLSFPSKGVEGAEAGTMPGAGAARGTLPQADGGLGLALAFCPGGLRCPLLSLPITKRRAWRAQKALRQRHPPIPLCLAMRARGPCQGA